MTDPNARAVWDYENQLKYQLQHLQGQRDILLMAQKLVLLEGYLAGGRVAEQRFACKMTQREYNEFIESFFKRVRDQRQRVKDYYLNTGDEITPWPSEVAE